MAFTLPFFLFPCCNGCHTSFFFLDEKEKNKFLKGGTKPVLKSITDKLCSCVGI